MSTECYKVLVKQDCPATIVTGYTNTVLIGSGATTVTNISGGTWIVSSVLSGGTLWGGITGDINNQTDLIEYISGVTSGITTTSAWSGLTGSPSDNSDLVDYVASEITGASTTLIGSGGTWTGLLSGTTWVVYSPDWTADILGLTMSAQTNYECCTGLTATFNDYTGDTFITLSGITVAGALLQAQTNNLQQAFTGHTGTTSIHTPYSAITFAISAATSGLTSSWSGLTGLPMDNADLVDLLSGYSLTSHTHTQYALVTTVTGLTSSFTSHTGDTSIHFKMSDITGFTSSDSFDSHTGNTDIHYPMSGISITESQISDLKTYLTGVTWSIITGDISGSTALQNALDLKLDNDDFNTYTGTTDTTITGIENDILYLSGITSGNTADIQWLSGYTSGMTTTLSGCTDVTITTPADNDILKYSGTTWVNEAPLDIFANVDDLEYLRRNGTSITGVTTIDILANVDDGQLLARNGTDITGVTNSFAAASDLTGLTASFNTYTGDTATALAAKVDDSTFTGHTGDTSIHFEMDEITGFTTTSDFNTYTGTTAPATYPTKTVIQTYTGTTAPATFMPRLVEIHIVTGATYTLVESDNNKLLLCTLTGEGNNFFVPTGLPVGFNCTVMRKDSGQYITIKGNTGVTVNAFNSAIANLYLDTNFAYCELIQATTNYWVTMSRVIE